MENLAFEIDVLITAIAYQSGCKLMLPIELNDIPVVWMSYDFEPRCAKVD